MRETRDKVLTSLSDHVFLSDWGGGIDITRWSSRFWLLVKYKRWQINYDWNLFSD